MGLLESADHERSGCGLGVSGLQDSRAKITFADVNEQAAQKIEGLVPTGAPDCLILSTTDLMMALTGMPAVLKERMALYCRFWGHRPKGDLDCKLGCKRRSTPPVRAC